MSSNQKKKIDWKPWAGLLLSVLFLYIALRHVDFEKTWKIILSSSISYLMLAVLACVFQFLIRAWRWRILLNPVKQTGFLNRFLSVLIGFAANCVLPARLGEFIRANSLGEVEKISKSSTFGTIVIARLFDGFVILLILLIGLLFTTFPDELIHISRTLRITAIILLSSYLLLIAFIVGFRTYTKIFIEVMNSILFMFSDRLKSKISDVVENFAKGLSPLGSAGAWAKAIMWSLLLWFISLCQIYFIEMSVGIKLPFVATCIVQAMAALGVMVPSAPGYIGTFDLSVQYGFLFYQLSKEKALSAAILLHGSFFFPTILLGLIAFIIMQTIHGKFNVESITRESSS